MPVSTKMEIFLENPGPLSWLLRSESVRIQTFANTNLQVPIFLLLNHPSLNFLSWTAACLPRPRQHLSHRTRLDVLETLSTRFIVKRPVHEAKWCEILQKLEADWVNEPSESINSEGVPIHVVQSSRKNRKMHKTRDLRSNTYYHALNLTYRLGLVFIWMRI